MKNNRMKNKQNGAMSRTKKEEERVTEMIFVCQGI